MIMEAYIVYELKVAIYIAVFYAFYRLMLSKETLHRLNRIMLVATAVLSFVLPFCVITINKTVELSGGATAGEFELPIIENAAVPEAAAEWWWIALIAIMAAGTAVCLMKILLSVLQINRIIREGELVHDEQGDRIIVTDRDISPCSWMNSVILSREDYESGSVEILAHEKAHINLGHSKDVLVVDILTAFQWFNPMMWMLKADLRAIHEFEADDAVLRQGANLKGYLHLLIKKAIGKSGYSVANSFNHSILKNRITMMSKSKSDLAKGLKVLYAVPLICLSLALNAEEKVSYVLSDDKDKTKVAEEKTSGTIKIRGEQLDTVMVVSYAPAEKKDIVVIIDGKLAKDGELAQLAPEQIKSMSIIKAEEQVAEYRKTYSLSDDVKDVTVIILKKPGEEKEENYAPNSYSRLETKPQFNGGDANEFAKWVNMNLIYPESARDAKHSGRVTIQFTINEEGSVVNAKVLRGCGHVELDCAALKLVESSPKWTPGTQDGKPVPVTYTFPVIFSQR